MVVEYGGWWPRSSAAIFLCVNGTMHLGEHSLVSAGEWLSVPEPQSGLYLSLYLHKTVRDEHVNVGLGTVRARGSLLLSITRLDRAESPFSEPSGSETIGSETIGSGPRGDGCLMHNGVQEEATEVSSDIKAILNDLETRNSHEPEFLQAVR